MNTKNLWYSLFATIFALILLIVTALATNNFINDISQYESYEDWTNKGFIYELTETVTHTEHEDGTILTSKCHLADSENNNIKDLNGNEVISEVKGELINQQVTFNYIFDLSNTSNETKKYIYNNFIRPLPIVIINLVIIGILVLGFLISIIMAIIYYKKHIKLNLIT